MSNTTVICETCGGALDVSADGLSGSCRYCKNTFYFKVKKGEELILAINRARTHRQSCDFHEAIKEYGLVIEKHPLDAEAHFGMLLSVYGIEFVHDRRTGTFIPTCHRYVEKDILSSEHYLAAMANASEKQQRIYTSIAEQISRLQRGIGEKLKTEKPYDVFICFKATDSDRKPTEDSVYARNIYDELTRRGINTFFSPVSLARRIGDEYEPIIHRALYSCKFFILVATKEEYVNAPWVKNEWARFEDRIAKEGLSGASAAVFRGITPYKLPRIFSNQGVDIEKHPFDYATVAADSIEKKLRLGNTVNEVDELRKRIRELEDKAAPGVLSRNRTWPEEFEKICDVDDEGVIVRCLDNSIAELVIPEGITGIANSALRTATELKSVTLSDSVRKIGAFAFAFLKKLASVKFGKGLREIAMDAFTGTALPSLEGLPEGLESIGSSAFEDCLSLTKIHIPSTVREIGDGAFCGNHILTGITVSENNEFFSSVGGNLYSKDGSVLYRYAPANKAASFTVPEGVVEIKKRAFSHSPLGEIKLPRSLERICDEAFHFCLSLKSISVAEENSAFKSVDGVLFSKNKKKIIKFPEGKTFLYA